MKKNRLHDKLTDDNVFLGVEASDRYELIREVAKRLGQIEDVSDVKQLAEDAIQREKELSTGIDRGIAMPHARTNAVSQLICAFVRPAQPIDFGSEDGKPCDLIFFSAVPRKCVDQYLHFTAGIVRQLQKPGAREGLRSAQNAKDVLSALGL
ncbi:PTS sugar transporter subunit IIA [bacterium]|nr:PTS sugar transporter subunit IIA [bacterium]